jgi:hypothetical protein
MHDMFDHHDTTLIQREDCQYQLPWKQFGAMDLETSFSLIQVSIQSETGGFLSP